MMANSKGSLCKDVERQSVSGMGFIRIDKFPYLNTKKVNGIEDEASSFLKGHFQGEEESSDGVMVMGFHSGKSEFWSIPQLR